MNLFVGAKRNGGWWEWASAEAGMAKMILLQFSGRWQSDRRHIRFRSRLCASAPDQWGMEEETVMNELIWADCGLGFGSLAQFVLMQYTEKWSKSHSLPFLISILLNVKF